MRQIFLLSDGSLTPMTEAPFESEDMLQELLAKHPSLLTGDESDFACQHRWLLVDREVGVPDADSGVDRWSLDHLFLDQDGVPTLVEVKRSSDTRIRREVVGQMLDYAANAVLYWPPEQLRARFEAACELRNEEPADLLSYLTNEHAANQEDAFWAKVKTNLQAGRIRMVFLADEIPSELKRVVEFLNGQMDPAEVLAVEVRQFLGAGGMKTLVPRVIGQTAAAEQKKGNSGQRRTWNEESFIASARHDYKLPAEQINALLTILKLATTTSDDVGWGTGTKTGSFSPKFTKVSRRSLFTVWSNGDLTLNFGWLNSSEAEQRTRDQFAEGLRKVPALAPYAADVTLWTAVRASVWAPVSNDFVQVVRELTD